MGCFTGVCVLAIEQGSWLFRPLLAHRHATGNGQVLATLSTPHAHTFSGCPVSLANDSC